MLGSKDESPISNLMNHEYVLHVFFNLGSTLLSIAFAGEAASHLD